jgi:hypothetical protein
LPLKKAIEPEWIKVEKELKVLSKFNNHEEYVDAESRLHPAATDTEYSGGTYMKVTISPEVVATVILHPNAKSQTCVNGPHLQEHRVVDANSGESLTPVTWECQ